jgi:hypothetical protein
MKKRSSVIIFLLLLCSFPLHAHVGSKDIFEEVAAGPYKLYVTIRPPIVIPGVATIEVRSSGASPMSIEATPTPMTGPGAAHPPSADVLQRSRVDPNFYTGSLWLMTNGSWEVRLTIRGTADEQRVAVPVVAAALSTLPMSRATVITLLLLGTFLVAGMSAIFGAAVREVRLRPGATPTPGQQRRSLFATTAALVVIAFLLWRGDKWWDIEAAVASQKIYRPLTMTPELHGDSLRLILGQPGTSSEEGNRRSSHDFIPDHGKMMHLYAIRQPGMDVAFHLHPTLHGSEFDLNLPQMPPGRYKLYGDVVHANGFPETLMSTLDVPATLQGTPLAADDAEGAPPPLASGMLGLRYQLPDGYSMVWDAPAILSANTGYLLRFRMLDRAGADAKDMQPYLGMAGHAAFVKTDGTVFAHVHPDGSAPMASMMLANEENDMDMPGMSMGSPIANIVEFPYGFPSPGRYRIFVQMKHRSTVETAAFDTVVH